MLSNSRIPTGGFPLGHSFTAQQDVLHQGWPLSYTLASSTQSLAHMQAIEQGKSFTDTNTPPPAMIDIPVDQAIAQVSDADILAYLQSNYGTDGSAYSKKVTSGDPQARLTAALVDKFGAITGLFLDRRWSGAIAAIGPDGRQVAVQGYDTTSTPPDKLAMLLRTAMNIFMGDPPNGNYAMATPFWIPEDAQWVETSDGTPTGTPIKLHQQVWFYLCDPDKIDGSTYNPTQGKRLTDSSGKTYNVNPFFSLGYIKMTHDPDPTAGQWTVDSTSNGQKGFYRLGHSTDFNDSNNYWLLDSDDAVHKWLSDNEEIITDACIVLVEMVVDYFDEGVTKSLWATVNPYLFGMVHAMVTGDASQLLTALAATAEWVMSQGFAEVKTDLTKYASGTLSFVSDTAQCIDNVTHSLHTLDPNTQGCPAGVAGIIKNVSGVGKEIGDVVDQTAKNIAANPSIAGLSLPPLIDPNTGQPDSISLAQIPGVMQGVGFGKQMLSAVYDKAYTANFKAITDEFAGVVRGVSSTTGVATFHDLGTTVDFDTHLSAIADSDWTHDNIKKACHDALDAAINTSVRPVPEYSKQQVYQGAAMQLALMIQTGQLTHENTQLRAYNQKKSTYQPGYVPPELAKALGSSGQVLSLAPLLKPRPVLASPIPSGISTTRDAIPSKAQIVAANNGVPIWGLGPTLTGLAIMGGGTAAAMYLFSQPISTVIKRPVAPWMIVLGAATVAGIYWYASRYNLKMPAVTVVPPPTGGAAGTSLPGPTVPTAIQRGTFAMAAPILMR